MMLEENNKPPTNTGQKKINPYVLDRRDFLKITGAAVGMFAFGNVLGNAMPKAYAEMFQPVALPTLDATTIPKFVDQLVIPPTYVPDPRTGLFTVDVKQQTQQILPTTDTLGNQTGFGPSHVFAYGGNVRDPVTCRTVPFRNAPGATFEAIKGKPLMVKYLNNITVPHLFAVDPSIHWANPNNIPGTPPWPPFPPGVPQAQFPVPIVTHLHGGEVPSDFDGGPNSWFTNNFGIKGPAFTTSLFTYPNSQQGTTLWYHDHVMGMTRLNVYSGLAGFYLLRDPADQVGPLLPKGKFEIPIAIQDRSFYVLNEQTKTNDLAFNTVGDNPDIHPYWVPEFFGDAIMVNGKTWPNLNVDRGQYRFRLLNGSHARFYTLSFSNGMSFIQIGTDGGYLRCPVPLTSLTIAPGERADILVDFTRLAPGTKVRLLNSANGPFPTGDPADPNTTGQIMQFTATNAWGPRPAKLPFILNPTIPPTVAWPTLRRGPVTRTLTLNESTAAGGPKGIFLNGQMFDSPITELPKNGSTEDWQIVNLTMDTHPIHLHLIQFQLVQRQNFDMPRYMMDWMTLNGIMSDEMLPLMQPTKTLPVKDYLLGSPIKADPNEMGWKDTVRMNPNQVTTIRGRWTSQDGKPFPFDPTQGPGYVWHCHILDHEDNEMMRPYKVVK